ncbi:MAG TPA: TolC family protein [Planctomycetaceae bacterium]|nr:TolC family protein [Planctomycetaceae bacterium]
MPTGGCLRRYLPDPEPSLTVDRSHYAHLTRQIEYPDEATPSDELLAATVRPVSLSSEEIPDYLDLSLEETMHIALAGSRVLRDLGGLVLRAPDTIRTQQDPSIASTDARTGVQAALSAFDASFTTSSSYENNDRALNNVFFGGGTRLLTQNFFVQQSQIAKTAATGSQFAVKNYTQYDFNNAPGNFVPGAWTTWFDLEARHPWLQGAGTDFNRLAGPNATPGNINGVVIARLNADTALADFETGVRNFVSDVENAYWDLYFAYRDLDAKVAARNASLETWQRIRALYDQGRRGGEAEKEAQAREQYFRFQEEAQNALHGRLIDGTRTNNGSSGGTFRGTGGVYVVERRLRLLIGLPINDGKLIRPSQEPMQVQMLYDWETSLVEALCRRVELRRQKWQIKRREAELAANKNFLLPQLDTVGRYRFRGFGDDLFPYNGVPGRFNNAWDDLMSGDFQEWQLGVEMSFPIGYRRAYAAVRHSELQLARERALLLEQERAVVYDLSNAIADVERAYEIVETNLNRRLAAREQLASVQAAFDADNASLDLLLEAQRRVAESDVAYYRSLVEYTLAVKNVHVEKGTLLDFNQVLLQEGAWADRAYEDARVRESWRGPPSQYDSPKTPAPTVSRGVFPQLIPTPVIPPSAAPEEGAGIARPDLSP